MICLIPARSGSKRLPGKNWLTVGGRTLVQRAVDCALGAWLKPYVVTDSGAPVKEHHGAVTLIRPDELAGDDVPTSAVVEWINPQRDVVVLLQPTAPFTTPDDVLGCIHAYAASDCDSVVSVKRVKLPGSSHMTYEHNGAIYVSRRPDFTGWTQLYVMPPERSVDIDTVADLEEARRLAGDKP